MLKRVSAGKGLAPDPMRAEEPEWLNLLAPSWSLRRQNMLGAATTLLMPVEHEQLWHLLAVDIATEHIFWLEPQVRLAFSRAASQCPKADVRLGCKHDCRLLLIYFALPG